MLKTHQQKKVPLRQDNNRIPCNINNKQTNGNETRNASAGKEGIPFTRPFVASIRQGQPTCFGRYPVSAVLFGRYRELVSRVGGILLVEAVKQNYGGIFWATLQHGGIFWR